MKLLNARLWQGMNSDSKQCICSRTAGVACIHVQLTQQINGILKPLLITLVSGC
jgi:hypothetical protein